jgi:hypothetical protein
MPNSMPEHLLNKLKREIKDKINVKIITFYVLKILTLTLSCCQKKTLTISLISFFLVYKCSGNTIWYDLFLKKNITFIYIVNILVYILFGYMLDNF